MMRDDAVRGGAYSALPSCDIKIRAGWDMNNPFALLFPKIQGWGDSVESCNSHDPWKITPTEIFKRG
jgi:hypothetical protein